MEAVTVQAPQPSLLRYNPKPEWPHPLPMVPDTNLGMSWGTVLSALGRQEQQSVKLDRSSGMRLAFWRP